MFRSPQTTSAARARRFAVCALSCALGGFVASEARAQAAAPQADREHELAELSLEDLMGIEVETVHGVSRRSQSSLEAPSHASVVGEDEIALRDARTLAEILRSVGGFDVTNDRNYEHLGVRGFNPLGDYNSRVLLTLDGHRLNNGVYDTAAIGRDLPIDVGLLERVEVARGPGSALYGSNAFFGVVELKPKTGADVRGLQLSTGAASFGAFETRATYGHVCDDGTEWLVSASSHQSRGDRLFYDEFASTPSGGWTTGTDDEQGYSVFSNWLHGDWQIEGGVGSREKGIPTGSYGTVFDSENHTTDAQGFLDVAWRPTLSDTTKLEARVGYDR
jgi:iron complex outermembrane receptor protein